MSPQKKDEKRSIENKKPLLPTKEKDEKRSIGQKRPLLPVSSQEQTSPSCALNEACHHF